MGEPLSPDRVFDFPVDEPEPHATYDFFAPGPLPGYAGNPNNNNGWIEPDVPLLGELGAVAGEPMVGPLDDEIVETIVEAEEQVIAPVIEMDEDIAMLFGDGDFKDDDSKGFDEEEVWESFPLLAPGLHVPSSVIEDLSTRLGNLEYEHEQLIKKVIQMAQAEDGLEHVCAQVEQGLQTATQRDKVIAELTQQVHALQADVQQRDSQIQQLQTMVFEMSNFMHVVIVYLLTPLCCDDTHEVTPCVFALAGCDTLTKEDHEKHLRLMLELLRKEKLYAKFKCEFWLQEVHFRGHVVNHNGIHLDSSKIKTLKDNLCNAPILSLPDGVEDFIVYCDASNQGLGCVLMQRGKKELNMRQTRWIELFSDYECEIRYHPVKANVVVDALSRKERVKPRHVREIAVTIQFGVKETGSSEGGVQG
uniref:Reverse transcriptase domain-containing protein n=1 Tax=Tanacetum cinerariifolium TaxID=118510 RepID=A0A6L2JHH6_TANCI|nr:reverse transcriptase domain-containing protein [Tanacetum cinerariifolium]